MNKDELQNVIEALGKIDYKDLLAMKLRIELIEHGMRINVYPDNIQKPIDLLVKFFSSIDKSTGGDELADQLDKLSTELPEKLLKDDLVIAKIQTLQQLHGNYEMSHGYMLAAILGGITVARLNKEIITSVKDDLTKRDADVEDVLTNLHELEDKLEAGKEFPALTKVFQLADECRKYHDYLIGVKSKLGNKADSDLILCNKITAMENLMAILDNKNDKNHQEVLKSFKDAFKEYTPLIKQRRDSASRTFLKVIGTILTFGILKKALWQTRGGLFVKQVQTILPKKKKSPQPHGQDITMQTLHHRSGRHR